MIDAVSIIKTLRADGASSISMEIEEIGESQYVNKLSVTYFSPPQVQMKVSEEPLPDDPDERRKEQQRRRDAIDFLSS